MQDTSSLYAGQRGRGRDADAPTEIPAAGWKDILYRLFRSINNDRILLTSAGVTFYLLLALVPTLTSVVAIYGLFNNRVDVANQVDLLVGLVPPGGLEIIREQLMRLTSESERTLSVTLFISIAIALWSASAGVKAMFEAMNIAYHEQERRSFFKLNGVALLFTLGGAVAAMMVVATVVILPAIIALLPSTGGFEWVVRVASYVVMLLVVSVSIAGLYRWGPSREEAKWRWITPGAAFAVLLLGAASIAFSWYVTNFSDYNASYGSLGALIALLTWLWISVTLVILGAELNSEVEHQTARDSTTGPEMPLGQRGAHMADHVGRVWPWDRKKLEKVPEPQRERRPLDWHALALSAPAAWLMGLARKRGRS
ncbi:MAG: YihY/virulence factor BrkB family protein [Devosia sp.]|nr:YihY/virulence factor BrkB family protein [Devosia sp.]